MEIGKLAFLLLRLPPAFPSSWFRGFNLLSDFPSALLPPGTPPQPHGSILALFLLAMLTPEKVARCEAHLGEHSRHAAQALSALILQAKEVYNAILPLSLICDNEKRQISLSPTNF